MLDTANLALGASSRGSNPLSSNTPEIGVMVARWRLKLVSIRPLSSVGRASVLHAEGHWFKSSRGQIVLEVKDEAL